MWYLVISSFAGWALLIGGVAWAHHCAIKWDLDHN